LIVNSITIKFVLVPEYTGYFNITFFIELNIKFPEQKTCLLLMKGIEYSSNLK